MRRGLIGRLSIGKSVYKQTLRYEVQAVFVFASHLLSLCQHCNIGKSGMICRDYVAIFNVIIQQLLVVDCFIFLCVMRLISSVVLHVRLTCVY